MKQATVGFIGGGNIAEGIFSGMLKKGFQKDSIKVLEVKEERCTFLKKCYGFDINLESFFQEVDVVVLAVKPQIVMDVLEDIKDEIGENHLVISVVAGLSSEKICKKLSTSQVVRAMPNTPSLIGQGITALTKGSDEISQEKISLVEEIFSSVGTFLWTEEAYFNGITALSGSGPAYVYKFIEALEDAGVLIGLPRPLAKDLALKTILGSTLMVEESDKNTKELSDQVTSPGGTTINGLSALERAGFSKAVERAVEKAYERSLELVNGGD